MILESSIQMSDEVAGRSLEGEMSVDGRGELAKLLLDAYDKCQKLRLSEILPSSRRLGLECELLVAAIRFQTDSSARPILWVSWIEVW